MYRDLKKIKYIIQPQLRRYNNNARDHWPEIILMDTVQFFIIIIISVEPVYYYL